MYKTNNIKPQEKVKPLKKKNGTKKERSIRGSKKKLGKKGSCVTAAHIWFKRKKKISFRLQDY